MTNNPPSNNKLPNKDFLFDDFWSNCINHKGISQNQPTKQIRGRNIVKNQIMSNTTTANNKSHNNTKCT